MITPAIQKQYSLKYLEMFMIQVVLRNIFSLRKVVKTVQIYFTVKLIKISSFLMFGHFFHGSSGTTLDIHLDL